MPKGNPGKARVVSGTKDHDGSDKPRKQARFGKSLKIDNRRITEATNRNNGQLDDS